MNNSISKSARLNYLDAVRAFALLLGIIFHASLSFMPIFIGWAVMDVSTSNLVSIFVLISHSFRMELFFLIAGFFSHMTFHRNGGKHFLISRWFRLAMPFLIAWFILRPLIISGWIMGGASMRGEVNILNALYHGALSLMDLPKDLFVGTHLWFLYYLTIITVSTLLLRWVFIEFNIISYVVDKTIRWASHSRFAIIILSIPTAGCLWFMGQWGMDTPDKSLVPHVPVLLIYGGFFIFGWLLRRQGHLIEIFSRLSWDKFVICIVAIMVSTVLSGYSMQTGHPQFMLIKIAFCLCYALMMWSLLAITIGLFKRLANRENATVRYIADASYWLYLIHLPIVIWLQIAFAELPMHWSIKLLGISSITILISLLIYDVIVRNTFIGAILNGKRNQLRPSYW